MNTDLMQMNNDGLLASMSLYLIKQSRAVVRLCQAIIKIPNGITGVYAFWIKVWICSCMYNCT